MRKLLDVPEPPELIRQAAVAHGMRPIRVDGVALVHRLQGTGGPSDPNGFRDQLIAEMKRDDVRDPNHLLERNDTALVRVRAVVPPGAQRRDPLDLRVLSPPGSRVSDLHGGKLIKCRLRHQQVLDRAVRESEVMVIGQGDVL
ncbi:MAG: flagellar basal body P-ring protein FlgI, partial [Pirellulales bacterium]|nr:flagellar basal body P-ring protein FlgI [Pirellulales bacterium]